MNWVNVLAGVAIVAFLVYLTAALLIPQKFE